MPTYGWNGTVDAGFAACARLPTRTLQRAVEKNHDARTPRPVYFLHAAQVTAPDARASYKSQARRAQSAQRGGRGCPVATHTRAAPRSTTKA